MHPVANAIAGGWSISGIYRFLDGQLLRYGGMLVNGDPSVDEPTRERWFNTDAFSRLPAFTRRTNPWYFDDIRGLLSCVQMGTVEFHGWGSRIEKVEYPDRLVFDLDPDVGLDFGKVKEAAIRLRALLGDMGLTTFPLLSGGKGLHVVVPLDASADWPAVKSFAERFSRAIAQAEPEMFTANIRKVERKGRIFLDWLRNQRGATAVMPYSARARDG